MQQLVPGALFTAIADAGHLAIEERPRLLLDEIRRFLPATALPT